MIAYMTGGHLDSTARNVSKKCRSIDFELKDGSVEWYRISGKKVGVRKREEKADNTAMARVFRLSNTMPPPKKEEAEKGLVAKLKDKASNFFSKKVPKEA